MARQHPGRRRQIYIDKTFQFRFIIKFCLILLAGVIVSSGLLFYFSQGTLTSSFTNSRLVIQPTGSAILPAIVWTNLIVLGLILVATIVVTLYISHKIAGPIFRLEKEITRIGEGDLTTHVALRSQDQMKAFAERVNTMTAGLNRKLGNIQRQAAELADRASSTPDARDLKQRAESLSRYIQEHFTL